MSKKISDLTAITTLAKEDILALVDFDADETKNITVENFMVNWPDAPISQGAAGGFENWGYLQAWTPGTPQQDYNGGGFYVSVVHDATSDKGNDIHGILSECKVQNSTVPGGYPTSSFSGVTGTAQNYGDDSQAYKLFGGAFDARVYGNDVDEVYGVMAQSTNISYKNATVGRVTGIYADAYTSTLTGMDISITTAYGAELRTFNKTTEATGTAAITTAYGLYTSLYNQQAVGSTATIGDAYNIFVTPYRPGGFAPAEHGLINNYYGIYIDDPVDINATNRWSLYVEGGDSYFGGNVDVERTLQTVSGFGDTEILTVDLTLDFTDNDSAIANGLAILVEVPDTNSLLIDNKRIQALQAKAFHRGSGAISSVWGMDAEARAYGGDVGSVKAATFQAAAYYDVSQYIIAVDASLSYNWIEGETHTAVEAKGVSSDLNVLTIDATDTAVSTITTAYGIKSLVWAGYLNGGTPSIGTAYGVYISDTKSVGSAVYGTITNYYGLYITEPQAAQVTNGWSAYILGRSRFDQPTSTAGIPVLELDQADLSEGFIDFLGTSAASAVGPISTWTSGNSIQGFVRVEINGSGYWMPFYDAPTS